MTPYTTRITRLTVAPENEPIFSEQAMHVEIDDEAAGEFIVIKQCHDHAECGAIRVNADEWPHIRAAVEQLLEGVKP